MYVYMYRSILSTLGAQVASTCMWADNLAYVLPSWGYKSHEPPSTLGCDSQLLGQHPRTGPPQTLNPQPPPTASELQTMLAMAGQCIQDGLGAPCESYTIAP